MVSKIPFEYAGKIFEGKGVASNVDVLSMLKAECKQAKKAQKNMRKRAQNYKKVPVRRRTLVLAMVKASWCGRKRSS